MREILLIWLLCNHLLICRTPPVRRRRRRRRRRRYRPNVGGAICRTRTYLRRRST